MSAQLDKTTKQENKLYLIIFSILGLILILFGILSNYVLPPLISFYIDQQIILSPQSQSYPLWKEIPVPVYQKFYFFNVTNAQEIEQLGHKPILEEIGPFTYRSDWSKRDIEFDELNKKISFKQFKQWQFEPDLSIADDRLQIITLNAPLAITLTLIQSASNAVRLLVTFSLDGLSDGFFTKRSIRQLLFDGYPDLLTTFGPLLNSEMLSQGGHFGYMNARNNSEDGNYEINTGLDDVKKLNTLLKYNGRSELTYWNKHQPGGGKCNSLDGASTGEMFPPVVGDGEEDDDYNEEDEIKTRIRQSRSIKLFQPDFCRVWRLDYDSRFQQDSGLRLQRFKATRDIFRNSTDLPENSCYFAHKKSPTSSHSHAHNNPISRQQANNRVGRHRPQTSSSASSSSNNNGRHKVRHEWPAGVFTLAPCKFNAPIYMSMPHFLDADEFFISKVEGLKPDRKKHEFYVDLEPRTGSPITMAARVQLNVAISKPPGLVRFRNVPEIMFPVFWQELSVNVTGPVIDQLLLATMAPKASMYLTYLFLLLGSTVILVVGFFYLRGHDEETVEEKEAPPPTQPPQLKPSKSLPATHLKSSPLSISLSPTPKMTTKSLEQ